MRTNKQRGSMCGGTDTRGDMMSHSLQSLLCNVSEYICNALEYVGRLQRCWKYVEFSVQECTRSYSDITPLLRWSPLVWMTDGVWSGCRGVMVVKILDDIGGIGQVVGWEPLIIRVWPPLELYKVVQTSIPILGIHY